MSVCASALLGGMLLLRQPKAATPIEPAPISVSTQPVTRRDVPIRLSGIGSVQPLNTVTIRARVDGELMKIGFAEGQPVRAGDVLAQIDPRPLQAQLAQAEAALARDQAQLENARLDLQRVAGLAKRQYTSGQSVDTQKAIVAQLGGTVLGDRAQLDFAKVQLGYTTIASPIDGVAGIRLVDRGNIVHASDATGLVMISQIQPIAALFTVPEDDLPAIRAALRAGPLAATAMDRAGEAQLATGTLAAIDNQIDPATAMVRLKAVFANADGALWPGQFVVVRLLLQTRRDQVVAPAAAIRPGPEGRLAFVVGPDRHVHVRHVTTGAASGDMTVVSAGLSPGETVVTEGQYKLEEGSLVDTGPAHQANFPARAP